MKHTSESEASSLTLASGNAGPVPLSVADGGTGSAQQSGFIAIADVLALQRFQAFALPVPMEHKLQDVEAELRHSHEQHQSELSAQGELQTSLQALYDGSLVLQDELASETSTARAAQDECHWLRREVAQLKAEHDAFETSALNGAIEKATAQSAEAAEGECRKLRIELEVAQRTTARTEARSEVAVRHYEQLAVQKDILNERQFELVRYELTVAENENQRTRNQLALVEASEQLAAEEAEILSTKFEELRMLTRWRHSCSMFEFLCLHLALRGSSITHL